MSSLALSLPDSLRAALESYAQDQEISLSQAVTRLLRLALDLEGLDDAEDFLELD